MGNLAVFIDAGYLFKQGAGAVFGEKLGRASFKFDAREFMSGLEGWLAGQFPSDQLLRTYWYDGARGGIPTDEQVRIGGLSFVKLRLGRINSSGQQKGVDTLIVRDLMILSQERSVQQAVVLSGDEDLREGIEYAQNRGVRVAVAGIEMNGISSQSVELRREADQLLTVPSSLLRSTMSSYAQDKSVGVAADSSRKSIAPDLAEVDTVLRGVGTAFADKWLSVASASEKSSLRSMKPSIPKEMDVSLLRAAVQATRNYPISDGARKIVRISFWEEIDKVVD